MKAWRIQQHGGIEALHWDNVELKEPGLNEVQIDVRALGVNHLDVWVRRGVEGHTFPLPITPGSDVSGTIHSIGQLDQTGKNIQNRLNLKSGSRVVVDPMFSDDLTERKPPIKSSFGLLGETRDGGASEKINVPIFNLVPLPDNVSFEQAACLPIAYVTAWEMLFEKAQIKAGHLILIQAGGSGVSVAATQLAKSVGATIITTVGTDEKVQLSKRLGADFVIQREKNDFKPEIKKILKSLGRSGVDIAIDHVGTSTFSSSLRALDWGGKIVTCGATSGSKIEIDLKPIFFKSLSILGSTMGSREALPSLVDQVKNRKLVPVIYKTFPFSQLRDAHEELEKRHVFGKIVLTR